ncbi:adhesion G protein-coupled receptor E3-like, partial [Clarias magur]
LVSVAFMRFSNMSDILKPTFSKTIINTNKAMMSTVVSVSLHQTEANTQLTKPFNLTFKHSDVLAPKSTRLCVSWKKTEWVEDDCAIIETNIQYSVCSCNHLGTFALITETGLCMNNLTDLCADNLLKKDQYNTAPVLPQKVVERYLNMTMDLMTYVRSTATDQNNITYYGNAVLNLTMNLVSTLVNKKDTNNISLSLPNLEVCVSVVVNPGTSSNNTCQLVTTDAYIDIDLIGISKNNKGSAAVAFMSYNNMTDNLKLSDTRKTIISTVVSATLPKTPNTWFTQPVNITFKHKELDTHGQISCVHWVENRWVDIGCTAIRLNTTHTMCSFDQLSVFALVIEILPCMTLFGVTVSLHCDSVLNLSIAQGFGVAFLTLCLLTFAFCCQTTNNKNTALINLCLNLLLFHLLDLLKPLFQLHLQPPEACAVVTVVRWFFFISTFVWMFIETVQLFLLVKNVSQIRSNQQHAFSWKLLNIIGYVISVGVLIVCSVFEPLKLVNEQCWDSQSTDIQFDIPILCIVSSNMLLFIIIIIMMMITMKRLRNENLQRSNANNPTVVMRVMFKSLAQFTILGCYWIFPYIPSEDEVLYNIFLFLNSQQGTFIFIVHCLLNQE